MPTITEIISEISKIDTSGRSGVDVNWPYVVRALQGLLAVYQGMDRSGALPSDHLTSFLLGDGTTRKLRRLFYDAGTQTVKIQKNTGTDLSPVWADLVSVNTAGNVTIAGALTGTLPAHASTHLPNGTDPLSTDFATDIGINNLEGTANKFSRSDHVHKGMHSIDKDSSGSPFYGDLNLVSTTRIPLSSGAGSITFGFLSPNRTYITTKSLGDQTHNTAAKLAVSAMSNLSIPGANGSLKYSVWCAVNISTAVVTATQVTLNIHLGTAGTIADAVFWASTFHTDTTTGTKPLTLVCSGLQITPTSSQKLTVSVELSAAQSHTIQHSDPKYCTLRIEEEL